MAKKVLVILGHPRKNSLCAALAAAYRRGAVQAGAEVEDLLLGDLAFDPVLRSADPRDQPLEKDLLHAQELITWAEHLVIVYPSWWGTAPALLKGFFDRAFVSGFAYRYRENSRWWDRLLAGRSARLLVTMDAPSLFDAIWYRRPGVNAVRRAVLGFCGVKPVRVTVFGRVRHSTLAAREAWVREAGALGAALR